MDCATCSAGLDHCHGTLVLHAEFLAECTEPGCTDLGRARHLLIIDCHSLNGGCSCVETEVRLLSA
ncbi:hypothetical protein [Amycolatopsis sp. 195334CR]|uniref:hypothetical protein n=1 Tax=Amycolatopsis sp. 195334CR TaxID=2814588 RepID=UPI001A8CCE7B|nr:hypothetical protein [Amycolatopsis sp. 195334CR]MBN6039247.1 hypothetical protein [Amycolatopsis sp. 195334CR]